MTGQDADSAQVWSGHLQPLHAGSIALGEFLRQRATQQRVVLHAHGRAHAALGVARFGSAVVVNPGSLRYTRTYASVTLEERRIEGRTEWRVTRAAVADISDRSNDAEEPPYVTSPHLAALALSMIVFLLVALAACARGPPRVPAPPMAFAPKKTPKSPQISGGSSVVSGEWRWPFTRGRGSAGGGPYAAEGAAVGRGSYRRSTVVARGLEGDGALDQGAAALGRYRCPAAASRASERATGRGPGPRAWRWRS